MDEIHSDPCPMKIIKKGDIKYSKGERDDLREKLLSWAAAEIRGK